MKSSNLILCLLLFLMIKPSYGQDSNVSGLKFSKAIFLTLTTPRNRTFTPGDTTFVIGKGKVWNITSANSFMIDDHYDVWDNKESLWLNDQIIHFHGSQFQGSLWLPEGTYNLAIRSLIKEKEMRFMAYLSGIEYSIEELATK
jgi:hypothetical protein